MQEGSEQTAEGQSWMISKHGQEKMWRVVKELQEFWQQRGRVVRVDNVPELADDAEAFKNAMLYLQPRSRREWRRGFDEESRLLESNFSASSTNAG